MDDTLALVLTYAACPCAQAALDGHAAFAAERAAAKGKAKGSEDAAKKWMRAAIMPFARYKRDEAQRVGSNQVRCAAV